jgi:hypothetical protein
MKAKKHNYVNSHDLYFETVVSKGRGKCSKKLNEYLYKIADGVSEKFRGINSTHQKNNISDDQLSEAYLALAERWQMVNLEKVNNVLPYYSEIAKRSCASTYHMLVNNLKNGGNAPEHYRFRTVSITDKFIF